MTDIVKLLLKAGDGGNGRVSLRREKYMPKGGPDGGDGGNGASIIIQSDPGLATLGHFAGKTGFEAERGQNGGKKSRIGAGGEDLILTVPVGTIIWLVAENKTSKQNRTYSSHFKKPLEKYQLQAEGQGLPVREGNEPELVETNTDFDQANLDLFLEKPNLSQVNLKLLPKIKLFEFDQPGQSFVIAKGGKGGKGNERFASASLQTPLIAEYGGFGEQKLVVMEQKLLADVGLVGFPNAGKSTLISILTKARPKIASYPFTTLEPYLGVVSHEGREAVIADIPGLIEGASEGKGLGFSFLRHVENTRILAFILSLDEAVIFDHDLSSKQKSEKILEQYLALKKELTDYSSQLSEKQFLVVINKSDLYDAQLQSEIEKAFDQLSLKTIFLSALTHQGLDELKKEIFRKI